nr:aminotransferase class V-fold PLP-dependent enzyme [Anaerolineae bacterium]
MSPLPRPVKQAMIAATEEISQLGSGAYAKLGDTLFADLPAAIAKFVGAKPEEVAFVPNTSTGINLIAQGLPLPPGSNVLLCDIEFPSNVYPWMNLATRGVETRLLPTRHGGLDLSALDNHRDKNSRVVAVSGVQFFTGRREDMHALGAYCKEHGLWLVVDAIQMAGIVPIDMEGMKIHALAAGGQKALCAPPGQGFMVIREEVIEKMTPVFVGPLSVENWEHWLKYDTTLRKAAGRFHMGTSNLVGLAGLRAAIDFLAETGVEKIAVWVTALTGALIEMLEQAGFAVITPHDPHYRANIVTFKYDTDPYQAVQALTERGIILREHLDSEGGTYLRASTHCYNTVEDINRLSEALKEIAYEQH